MILRVIPFEQPIGTFLLSVMSAADIIRIARSDPRKFDNISMETIGGIQREPSSKRITEIAEYANTVDATFPTPILLALDSGTYSVRDDQIDIQGEKIADIVDGQHRLLGLEKSGKAKEFVIPVVFLLDATDEQKALIFATINGKQTKVPASLIYDLFGITKTRSPQKTAHEIARAINSAPSSPWFKRLKMLGKKTPGSLESLSQGTFVKFLLPHVSADPVTDRDLLKVGKKPLIHKQCAFNEYFRHEKDSIILKILMNIFQAVRETWPEEWDNPTSYILTKTTGFSGIMRALPTVINKGKTKQDLSAGYFKSIFELTRAKMQRDGLRLNSTNFPPSADSERNFASMIAEATSKIT